MNPSNVEIAQEISALLEGDEFQVGAQLAHGTAGTESFEVKHWTGKVYRVCVVPIPVHRSSEFKPEPEATQDGPGFKLPVGLRVRSGLEGPAYGRNGEIRQPAPGAEVGRIWILWEGNVMPNGYLWNSDLVRCLQQADKTQDSSLFDAHGNPR